MFKYVEYKKVETEYTVLEFRGGDEDVKINHFSDNKALEVSIVSIECADVTKIDALIASQTPEINCVEILQAEFKTLVSSSAQFARIKTIVDEAYTKDVNILVSQYPAIERETWATQLAQAIAFKASGNDEDAPFLKTLADAENDTVLSFADAVIVKANEYESVMAQKLIDKRAMEKSLMATIGL